MLSNKILCQVMAHSTLATLLSLNAKLIKEEQSMFKISQFLLLTIHILQKIMLILLVEHYKSIQPSLKASSFR